MERLATLETLRPKTIEERRDSSTFLKEAYRWAEKAHRGKKRDSGEDYVTHCLEVARINYEEWGINDEKIIAAAFLHDTVEDTNITLDQIRDTFGEDVASWVDGVTKLGSKEQTIQKVNNATYIEPQVGIIKSSDRLHNMRTLQYKSTTPEKRVEKAKETLFYAKLAESLGMWDVMRELEDLSFQYINPDEYTKYLTLRDKDPRTEPEFVEGFESKLRAILKEVGVEAQVEDRKNSLLRIKDKRGNKSIDRIDDLIRFGIIIKEGETDLETRNRIGVVLMALWNEFDPIEEKSRFDNFYFTTQDNGYSAFHLTIRLPGGSVKIAITSQGKDTYNKHGILSLINNGETNLHKFALKLVLTPTGEVKFFKPNATGVDYAYSISPQTGARADYMLYNDEEDIEKNRHLITEIIPNGAKILIKLKVSRQFPKKVFGDFALPPAKTIIDDQIEEQDKFNKATEGMKIVEKILKDRGFLNLEDLKEIENLQPIYNDILLLLGCKENIMDLYYRMGSDTENFMPLFVNMLDKKEITKDKIGLTSIYIEGVDHSGISAIVTKEIANLGGSIVFQKGNVSKINNNTFSLKFIVENLSNTAEKNFPTYFDGNVNITKIVIV